METFDILSCNLLYCRYRLCIKAVDVLRPSKPDNPGVYITRLIKKDSEAAAGPRLFSFAPVQIYHFLIILLL